MEGTAGSDSSTHLDCIHLHGPTSHMGRWNRQLTDTKSVLAPPLLQLSQYTSAQHFSGPSWRQFNSPTQQKIASFFTYSVLFWLSKSKCLVTDPVRTKTNARGEGGHNQKLGDRTFPFRSDDFLILVQLSHLQPCSGCTAALTDPLLHWKVSWFANAFFLFVFICVFTKLMHHIYTAHI